MIPQNGNPSELYKKLLDNTYYNKDGTIANGKSLKDIIDNLHILPQNIVINVNDIYKNNEINDAYDEYKKLISNNHNT